MGRISRLLYPETGIDAIVTITLFLALGIWLVIQRYKTIRDRAVLFYWPAPLVRVIPKIQHLKLCDCERGFALGCRKPTQISNPNTSKNLPSMLTIPTLRSCRTALRETGNT
jgi:hypothetical protein